jgi:hypothetical protein
VARRRGASGCAWPCPGDPASRPAITDYSTALQLGCRPDGSQEVALGARRRATLLAGRRARRPARRRRGHEVRFAHAPPDARRPNRMAPPGLRGGGRPVPRPHDRTGHRPAPDGRGRGTLGRARRRAAGGAAGGGAAPRRPARGPRSARTPGAEGHGCAHCHDAEARRFAKTLRERAGEDWVGQSATAPRPRVE